jgi:hypothetical protein
VLVDDVPAHECAEHQTCAGHDGRHPGQSLKVGTPQARPRVTARPARCRRLDGLELTQVVRLGRRGRSRGAGGPGRPSSRGRRGRRRQAAGDRPLLVDDLVAHDTIMRRIARRRRGSGAQDDAPRGRGVVVARPRVTRRVRCRRSGSSPPQPVHQWTNRTWVPGGSCGATAGGGSWVLPTACGGGSEDLTFALA